MNLKANKRTQRKLNTYTNSLCEDVLEPCFKRGMPNIKTFLTACNTDTATGFSCEPVYTFLSFPFDFET